MIHKSIYIYDTVFFFPSCWNVSCMAIRVALAQEDRRTKNGPAAAAAAGGKQCKHRIVEGNGTGWLRRAFSHFSCIKGQQWLNLSRKKAALETGFGTRSLVEKAEEAWQMLNQCIKSLTIPGMVLSTCELYTSLQVCWVRLGDYLKS